MTRLSKIEFGLCAAALLAASSSGERVRAQCELEALTSPDRQPHEARGAAVDVAESWLFVGAPGADGQERDTGSVAVFRRAASGWIFETTLSAAIPQQHARFGSSLSASDDRVAIGAPCASGPQRACGAVYVFERTPRGWIQSTRITASDAGPGQAFGAAVSLSGQRVLVGAPGHDQAGPLSGRPTCSSPTPAAGASRSRSRRPPRPPARPSARPWPWPRTWP